MGEAPTPTPALQEAVRLHRAGDLGRAVALYREAIAAAPVDADALHPLGVLCHQKGVSALGIGHIGRALLVRPGSALFQRNLAGIPQALHALPLRARRARHRISRAQRHLRRRFRFRAALIHSVIPVVTLPGL